MPGKVDPLVPELLKILASEMNPAPTQSEYDADYSCDIKPYLVQTFGLCLHYSPELTLKSTEA